MNRFQMAIIFVLLAGCDRGVDSRSVPPSATRGPSATGHVQAIDEADEHAATTVPPDKSHGEGVVPPETRDGPIRPDISRAVLIVGGRSIFPSRIRPREPSGRLVGESLIVIRDATVESLDNATGGTLWSAKSEPGTELQWLGLHKGILFLSELTADGRSGNEAPASCTSIGRLRLQDGSWLKSFALPLNDEERAGTNRVSAFLPDGAGILVLSNTKKDEQQVSYRVTRFAADSGNVIWSNDYESAGTVPAPEAFLLGSQGPARDGAAVQGLSAFGSHVLLCGGAREDLIAIDPHDGTAQWRLPRVWEFRRGFIGPSVWRHFLGRFGIGEHDLELAALTLEQLRARNEQQDEEDATFASEEHFEEVKQRVKVARERFEREAGSIVGGPIIVATRDNEYDLRAFVACARNSSDEWPGYLSDCIIYEIDSYGAVIGTLTMPHFVRGADFAIFNHFVIWRSEAGEFARLFPSFEGGNGSRIIDLEWRRDRRNSDETPWFQNGSWTDSVVFDGRWMFHVKHGGFIEAPESQEYRFRFAVTDLATDTSDELLLHVPFTGRVVLPVMNYSRRSSRDGREMWTIFDSFPISFAGFEVSGGRLVIRLDDQRSQNFVEFDLQSVLSGSHAGK